MDKNTLKSKILDKHKTATKNSKAAKKPKEEDGEEEALVATGEAELFRAEEKEIKFKKVVETAKFPEKNEDGTYDVIYSGKEIRIPPDAIPVPIETGIEIKLPLGYIGLLVPRRRWWYSWKPVQLVGMIHGGRDWEEISIVISGKPLAGGINVPPGTRLANLVVIKNEELTEKKIDYTPPIED